MKWLAAAILALGVLFTAAAQANHANVTHPGWKPGDVYMTDTFCVSEAAMEIFVSTFIVVPAKTQTITVGCYNFPQAIPFRLVEQVAKGVDFEGDVFFVWRVREFYREDIFVVLYTRPEIPLPLPFRGS